MNAVQTAIAHRSSAGKRIEYWLAEALHPEGYSQSDRDTDRRKCLQAAQDEASNWAYWNGVARTLHGMA